jgi:predicted phosphodiesterase
MDIAVLEDVHGNYVALERCLEYAFSRNIITFFFLGDYVRPYIHEKCWAKSVNEMSKRES